MGSVGGVDHPPRREMAPPVLGKWYFACSRNHRQIPCIPYSSPPIDHHWFKRKGRGRLAISSDSCSVSRASPGRLLGGCQLFT